MKARQAKKLLKHLVVMRLEPGDVIVVSSPRVITRQQADQMKQEVQAHIPHSEVLVIGGDIQISAIRPPRGGGA